MFDAAVDKILTDIEYRPVHVW